MSVTQLPLTGTKEMPVTTFTTKAYGASGALIGGKTLEPMDIERSGPAADEVQVEVLYCGVCHSDLHQVQNDWGNTIYPCVPGHEIVGIVAATGSAVTRFKTGDIVGVGCMINSCGVCPSCLEKMENYCEGPVSWTATYNGYMKPDGSKFNTFGGYSTGLVVKESFLLRIPDTLDIKAVAPILCAGVTTYSPLKHWKVKAGDKVGVVGIGGLGHMAVQIATAMGAEVTAITHTQEKRTAALELGAHAVLLSGDEEAMTSHAATFDFIINTIPDAYDVNLYIPLLKRDATLVAVGVLAPYKKPTNNMEVAMHRRSVAGSLIGSIEETQEVLDFCAKHHILPDVEMLDIQYINEAYEKMLDNEIRFRYVIDMASLKRGDGK